MLKVTITTLTIVVELSNDVRRGELCLEERGSHSFTPLNARIWTQMDGEKRPNEKKKKKKKKREESLSRSGIAFVTQLVSRSTYYLENTMQLRN